MTNPEKPLKDKILDNMSADKEHFFEVDGKTYVRYDKIEVAITDGKLRIMFFYKDELACSNGSPVTGMSRIDELGAISLSGLYGGVEIKLN